MDFKYNGKELEESLGYGMYEYEARHYDATIARFVTIDPLAEDYSFQTPYAYAINDPVRYIDKFGMGPDDLILTGKAEDIAKAVENINSGLGGDYASVDSNGKVTLNVTDEQAENFTEEQKGFFNEISKPINSDQDTTIKIVSGDEEIIGGGYKGSVIDIDDVNNFGTSDEAMTKYSVMAHEIVEQYEKQVLGNDEYVNDEGNGAHQNAMQTEKAVTGYTRGETKFSDRTFTKRTRRGKSGFGTVTYYVRSYTAEIPYTKDGKTVTVKYSVVNGNVVAKD